MEEIKKVVGVLLTEFVKEEAGNRVTSNNMAGLQMKIMMALDGKISMNPPEDAPKAEADHAKIADLH
jgi:hypothetical protein